MKTTTSNLIRWAGLSAMVAGICYVLVGLFHPLNVLASVTTPTWVIVHILASAMCFFGLLGIVGLYARQAEKSGKLGLIGFGLWSVWLVLTFGFTFAETFILPQLATVAPKSVEGFMGVFTGAPSEISFGVLPTLWSLIGLVYILGGLLFGIATFRAGVLPRWAGALLAFGTALTPLAALLPPELEPKVTVPVGLALAWMGYALLSEQREKASESLPVKASVQLGSSVAE